MRCTSLFVLLAAFIPTRSAPPVTGPETEKRFPPLQVPPGFKATLFACDPFIEYPSVIALGPRPRSLFVAVDYMTGLGTDIVKRDEIRLIEDTDGDGYADKSTVFASGFNSIQGLAYHDGTVYVMHAPYLSAVREVKGKPERRDLLTGIGLAPEVDQIRLHNANGVVVGHDGWLYLAIGDRGCDIKRPEGDRLVYHGGGILRCRPDGRDLHIFSTGLRNIYDVALDEDLNVFVRDNENDGGDYKIRVCHSFFGADHGYPYHYYERPDEALTPLADLGLGSSAGVVCYLEKQFPAEYRGNLFACEWGRSVVRYPLKRAGTSFERGKEIEFAAGAANDPYGFKPTDLVVDRDGSLFISDWADGQRPKRGRGRIYLVRTETKADNKEPAKPRLDSESYFERCQAQLAMERDGELGFATAARILDKHLLDARARMHAVWIVAKVNGAASIEQLFDVAQSDPELRVRVQAIRAIADLADPVLVRHKLDAGRGDGDLAERLAKSAAGRDERIILETVLALGRLRWKETPAWLRKNLEKPDTALAHAALWALRQSDNWLAVLKLLDDRDATPMRAIALRALAEQYDTQVVDGLMERLKREADASRRREYADLLTRVYKKPASPWTYWGFRPPPRPANSVDWERTAAIERALDSVLGDADRTVRLDALRRMLREKVPAKTASLGRWLTEEHQPESVAVLLAALHDRPSAETRTHLENVIADKKHAVANRLAAATAFVQGLDAKSEGHLLDVSKALEDGPVLGELLRAIGQRKLRAGGPLLLTKLESMNAPTRASAVAALAELGARDTSEKIRKLLDDADAGVRSAAATAAGKLEIRPAGDALLKLAMDADAQVRRSSIDALRRLQETRAVPVAIAALRDPEILLEALECLGAVGGPAHVKAVTEVATRQPSVEVLGATGKVLIGWAQKDGIKPDDRRAVDHALAEIHGVNGILLAWRVHGPMDYFEIAPPEKMVLSTGIDARVAVGRPDGVKNVWMAYCEIHLAQPERVEFFTSGSGSGVVSINGSLVYQRDKPGPTGPYPDRFEVPLSKGTNRVIVSLANVKETGEFQLRFRRKSATPERERFALAALARAGNPARGREVFFNAEKSLCIKCHRVGDQGERIGPELSGLGSRFSKIYIVESVLEPSRTIAPSYETHVVTLNNGKQVIGVKIAETGTSIDMADEQGKKYTIARSDIDEITKRPVSTMPEGLDKRLTEDEFVDLISFLVNLKAAR